MRLMLLVLCAVSGMSKIHASSIDRPSRGPENQQTLCILKIVAKEFPGLGTFDPDRDSSSAQFQQMNVELVDILRRTQMAREHANQWRYQSLREKEIHELMAMQIHLDPYLRYATRDAVRCLLYLAKDFPCLD